MSLSPYFCELCSAYAAEIDDLLTDSEGRSALKKRLNEKRSQFSALLSMIEFSPEMVAVAFYGAFSFQAPKMMQALLRSEPDDGDFMIWDEIQDHLTIAEWAMPLLASAMEADGGDLFMVSCAALEYQRLHDTHSLAAPQHDAVDDEERDEHDDELDGNDLAETGSDWLTEQGFETIDAN